MIFELKPLPEGFYIILLILIAFLLHKNCLFPYSFPLINIMVYISLQLDILPNSILKSYLLPKFPMAPFFQLDILPNKNIKGKRIFLPISVLNDILFHKLFPSSKLDILPQKT